jgi:hypothetical protein
MLYYYHWVDTSGSGLLVPRGHHPSSSQCFGIGMFYYYHWVDTSAGGLLVPEDIIRPVVNASALACCITSTGSIPLLVDY